MIFTQILVGTHFKAHFTDERKKFEAITEQIGNRVFLCRVPRDYLSIYLTMGEKKKNAKTKKIKMNTNKI